MSVNSLNTFLNIRDAHLRVVSGNVHATAMNIGGINVDVAHGLQSVTNQGNVTSNTLQFSNSTTAFVTTANVTVGRDLTVTGNALVSSNLTVTGNVTVSDTLTVTENLFVSNNLTVTKDVTVTGNTFYTNPMSISVDSNVVAEYTGPHDRPLRKYPEVALTANDNSSTSGYVADQTAFSGNADGNAYRLFDHSLSTAYQSGGSQYSSGDSTGSAQTTTATDGTTHQGVAITLDLATKIRLSYAKITSHTYYGRTPVEGTFLGSNNNSTWDVIGTFSGLSTTAAGQTHMVHISDYATKSAYRYIRLVVTKIHTSAVQNGGSLLEFRELEYYGHEEGDSSLDTTLKSVYNVPGTQQLEVYYDAKDLADGAVTSVTDLSPNTNNGTVSGDPQVSNGAFVFDGVGDSIGGSITNGTGETNFTISMWVKSNVLNDAPFLFGEDVTNKGIGMTLNPGITFMYVVGGVAYQYNTSDLIRIGEWSHLLLYRNSGEMSVYVNGIYIYPIVTGSGALDLNANTQFTLGSRDTTEYFTGSIANFRLFSKALNAGQVQELYDYQKDYFLGTRSSVTLYKGHLGIGVAEPSGQLELAGDERIQEYPPGPMSGYETMIPGHGVFCAYASSDLTVSANEDYLAWEAFDKNLGSIWYPPGSSYNSGVYQGTDRLASETPAGAYLVLEMPYKIYPKRVQQYGRSNGAQLVGAAIYYAKANPGDPWTPIHTQTSSSSNNGTTPYIGIINSNVAYQYFAIVVTSSNPTGNDTPSISNLVFFGTPGPTTLDKGSLTLGRSLDVPRISRYDVDTETPRPEKLVLDFDTTVNSSPTDISGKGNHGAFYGTASYSPADKAFSFPGRDSSTVLQYPDYIQTTVSSGWTDNQTHTHTSWIKIHTITSFDQIFGLWDSASTGLNYSAVGVYTDRFSFYQYASEMSYTYDVSSLIGQWCHIVAIHNGNIAESKFYLNGIELASTRSAGTATALLLGTAPKLALGKDPGRSNATQEYAFDGLISNYKLYNVALEPSEVQKLYRLGRTGRSMVISDTAVGIGKVPEAQLDVRGNINSEGIMTNKNYMFFATGPASAMLQPGVAGGNDLVANFSRIEFILGSGFDTSTKTYTIPCSGYWEFSYCILARNVAAGAHWVMGRWLINGVLYDNRTFVYFKGNTDGAQESDLIGKIIGYYTAGTTISVRISQNTVGTDVYMSSNYSHFFGKLLH
jgi:hypothetical protein